MIKISQLPLQNVFDGNDSVLLTDSVDGLSKKSTISFITQNKAPINNPTFTGIPSAPTATTNTNSTQIATTAFVKSNLTSFTSTYIALDNGSPYGANLVLASAGYNTVSMNNYYGTYRVTDDTSELFKVSSISGNIWNKGAVTTDGGVYTPWVEMGYKGIASTPFVDFNSSGNDNDYDARIIATGGGTTLGTGALTILASSIQLPTNIGIGTVVTKPVGTAAFIAVGDSDSGLGQLSDGRLGMYINGRQTLLLDGSTGLSIQGLSNQLRLKPASDASGYAVLHRNDGSYYYNLITNVNDSNGNWNSLRPLIFNLSTGMLSSENGQYFLGGTRTDTINIADGKLVVDGASARTVTAPIGDNTTKIATTEFVMNELHKSNIIEVTTLIYTIRDTDFDMIYNCTGAAVSSIYLPTASVQAGHKVTIINNSSHGYTINIIGTLFEGTSIVLPHKSSIVLVSDGTKWISTSGYLSSNGGSAMTRLGGGLVIQYGTGTIGAAQGSTSLCTFPLAFTGACQSVYYTFTNGSTNYSSTMTSAITNSNVTFTMQNYGNYSTSTQFTYMAIGY
jgi:hypothetical protein